MSILDGFKSNQGTGDQTSDMHKTDAVTSKVEPVNGEIRRDEPKRVDRSKAHVPSRVDKPKKKGFFGGLIGGGAAEDKAYVAPVTTDDKKKPIDMEYDDYSGLNYGQSSGSGFGFGSGSGFVSYKTLENKKFYVILVENSEEIDKIKDMISAIIGNYVVDEKSLTCIVNYGGVLHFSEPLALKDLTSLPVLVENDIGILARLYDALCALKTLIDSKKKSIEDDKTKRVIVNSIDILCIGTCRDVGSKHSKDEAIAAFDEIIRDSTVTTKYICLTEDGFKEAAEFGFKSIGSISVNYQ